MKPDSISELDRREARIHGARMEQSSCGQQLAGGNETLEMSERVVATPYGGIGLIHRLARQIGLPDLIDDALSLLKLHLPYHESDHVLNIAYNVVCGGKTLDDIERLRNDEAYLRSLGTCRLPDPTTAGDFLRRFRLEDIDALMEAINTARMRVWSKMPKSCFDRAVIEINGTISGTSGACKEGMDMSYKGIWGYAPLLVTLANTGGVLYSRNRPGNRPSHDGAFGYLDPAVELVREAGFRSVLLRGDSHFALTDDFDHWSDQGVRFVFGLAHNKKLDALAEAMDDGEWCDLRRDAPPRSGRPRAKKTRVKLQVIKERKYKHITLEDEVYTEISYRPTKCKRDYRVIVVKKTIRVEKGNLLLIPQTRYFFYITNAPKREMTARRDIRHANRRCNQENLIEQMKNGVRAMRMPCDTLLANDAYMAIAGLAWNLKAWLGLLWPDAEQGEKIRRMDFRRFVANFIAIPCQAVRSGRRIIHRFLAFNGWLASLFDAHAAIKTLKIQ